MWVFSLPVTILLTSLASLPSHLLFQAHYPIFIHPRPLQVLLPATSPCLSPPTAPRTLLVTDCSISWSSSVRVWEPFLIRVLQQCCYLFFNSVYRNSLPSNFLAGVLVSSSRTHGSIAASLGPLLPLSSVSAVSLSSSSLFQLKK